MYQKKIYWIYLMGIIDLFILFKKYYIIERKKLFFGG